MSKLFRRKIFTENYSFSKFSKELSTFSLIIAGLGAILGTGIFVLPGVVAARYTGPALTISFISAGFSAFCVALSYSELASIYPKSEGGAYAYTYFTLGEIVAWITGWALILEYFVVVAIISVSWSGYFANFIGYIGINLPDAIMSPPIIFTSSNQLAFSGSLINLPSIFIFGIVSIIIFRGIRWANFVNTFVVILKLLVIFLFICFGLSHIDLSNYIPYIPSNTGVYGQFGLSGILRGMATAFPAFIGFDVLTTLTQECKNPQKAVPRGITLSLLSAVVLYISVSIVLTGIVNYTTLDVPQPLSYAVNQISSLRWLIPILDLGAILGLVSGIIVYSLGLTRTFYSISNDGMLPKNLCSIHPKFKTPYKATIILAVMGMVVVGLFPIGFLANLISIGALTVFIIICCAVIVFRKRQPDIKRLFKAPLVPFLPILGIITCAVQMLSLPFLIWMIFIAWMGFGLLIYFIYSREKSLLNIKLP
ncbi:MAG: amino acid permease [Methanobrevibacter sp.]|nr:amino acid permease [Candidatus Methanovirga basalitermitum]